MNDNLILENIFTRKSIRKFTEEKISQAKINKILKAAMAAPTAKNRRPYHFIVIEDQVIKDKLSEVNPYSKMIKESSHTIVVCGDTIVEETLDFIHHDCAAATQNILLAVHALGLGAVWVGVRQSDSRGWDTHVKTVLKLPKHIIPIALIPMGYPDQTREVRDTFETDKIHNNTW